MKTLLLFALQRMLPFTCRKLTKSALLLSEVVKPFTEFTEFTDASMPSQTILA